MKFCSTAWSVESLILAQSSCSWVVTGRPTGTDAAPRGHAVASHRPGERIIPAGIENDDAQFLRAVGRRDQPVERDRLILGVTIAGEVRVDRNQIVGAANLDAMAGIVDDG